MKTFEEFRSDTTECLDENLLQDIQTSAKMFRIMTGIDKIPSDPQGKAGTTYKPPSQPSKPTPKPYNMGSGSSQSSSTPSAKPNRVLQGLGALMSLRKLTPMGVATAVMAPRPTADATLQGALRRGEYKPMQGPPVPPAPKSEPVAPKPKPVASKPKPRPVRKPEKPSPISTYKAHGSDLHVGRYKTLAQHRAAVAAQKAQKNKQP